MGPTVFKFNFTNSETKIKTFYTKKLLLAKYQFQNQGARGLPCPPPFQRPWARLMPVSFETRFMRGQDKDAPKRPLWRARDRGQHFALRISCWSVARHVSFRCFWVKPSRTFDRNVRGQRPRPDVHTQSGRFRGRRSSGRVDQRQGTDGALNGISLL